jgi:hypothetical protein
MAQGQGVSKSPEKYCPLWCDLSVLSSELQSDRQLSSWCQSWFAMEITAVLPVLVAGV